MPIYGGASPAASSPTTRRKWLPSKESSTGGKHGFPPFRLRFAFIYVGELNLSCHAGLEPVYSHGASAP